MPADSTRPRELTTEPIDDRDPLDRLVDDAERIADSLELIAAAVCVMAGDVAARVVSSGVTHEHDRALAVIREIRRHGRN